MYAKVIVDVPAKQTDRPFDYIVPEPLRDWVAVGSRVGVPFGPRVLQGFVVELQESSDLSAAKLKPIEQVLDLYPPLTPELVELGRWLSETYLCPYIIALQAMVPGALKSKYERHVKLSGDPSYDDGLFRLPVYDEIIAFVQSKGSVELNALLEKYRSSGAAVKDMLSSGTLVEFQFIKGSAPAKTALTVFPPEQPLQYVEQIPARSPKQRDVLHYFADHPGPVKLSELVAQLKISASTVKGLAEKGIVAIKEVEIFRDPYAGRHFQKTSPLSLTDEQQAVFGEIKESVADQRHAVFLLQGVTGSGKTEVYLQAIQQCLDMQREAIVLVPEISLTPQMVERFKGRFGDEVAVMHSRLSQGERYDEWRKIMLKQAKVAIGARSAIFAPFSNIGLIIIDEEHETSYKQEESPKYHARDAAIARARKHRAAVVLGSATPSLESVYRTTEEGGYFRLLSMKSRVENRPLPKVNIVDMRDQLKAGNRSMFSRPLYKAIEERLHKKEQIVLLLNRRGYSTFVMCRTCGYVASCPHCDISLTYHQQAHSVRCHYCGYAEREPVVCPSCQSEHIRHFGTGTQRVEEELSKLFPGIRVIRMDMDTTTEKGSHEKWLNMFKNRQADVLLGTQMVAKGLDFPYVTLVGALAADSVLNLPDFRSAERTFQLLTQVAGRAGRHELPGEVFVQTYTPEHYSVISASHHDYAAFMREEMAMRRTGGYPPYCRLILVTFSHEQLQLLVRTAETFVSRLKESGRDVPGMDVLGPVASPLARIKDRYRFQCMIKYRGGADAARLVRQTADSLQDTVSKHKLQISVDVDPQLLM
ncbi:primosomal protein N' [Paenibacillus thalictri]|uniref:Replication restart protein PriA n=1 Tax=Paenibacillus thalictri TaxID=2527873 RepID=A0A4Q9DPS5_9BACL|nr:primosomal protein N' [Paenibacillus thalictri]TBL78333.1 primosomal protein N' [Paenibacillus thalictri]